MQDDSVPMWIIKAKGETYYINHLDCSIPWTTKETPDNDHTKGSIKFKKCLITIDENNCATISQLTIEDEIRLLGHEFKTRIITSAITKLQKALENSKIQHGPLKYITGGCSTRWVITEINPKHFTLLGIAMSGTDLRILKPNENYYEWYDGKVELDDDDQYEDDLYEDEDA